MTIHTNGKTFEVTPLEAEGHVDGEFAGNIEVRLDAPGLKARKLAHSLQLHTPKTGRIKSAAYGDDEKVPAVVFHDEIFERAMPETIELWWVDENSEAQLGTLPVAVVTETKTADKNAETAPLSLSRGWDYGRTELSADGSTLLVTRHRLRRVVPLLLVAVVSAILTHSSWKTSPAAVIPGGFFIAAFIVGGMHVVAQFDLRRKTFSYRRSWLGIPVRRCEGKIEEIERIVLTVCFYFHSDDTGGPRRNAQLRFIYRGKKYFLESDGPCSWKAQARALGKLLQRPVRIEET